ncbi:MAG: shikimate kinase [Alphaproteobacteria bacterium]|nr:shikimate kinase [Alphaproteobacteria bacterium]
MPKTLPIIVLVGLMGAGKSRVGLELSRLLDLPFVDADREIEKAAGMPIPDIFAEFGEAEFRKGEMKVIDRLLKGPPIVLASGGGAFIQPAVRSVIKKHAVSVWLKADLDTLVARTRRTGHRPLLQGVDRAEKLRELMESRYPVYAEADITLVTDKQTPQTMARRIRRELAMQGKLPPEDMPRGTVIQCEQGETP